MFMARPRCFVHPDLERAAAKRMGATTYILDVIRTAAASI
jgi:hypothetical protein